jgi:hypothetical protein
MKRQINPTINVYFIRGALCLMLLGVCAIPFALAHQSPTNARPQLQQHQQATARPTPSRDFGTDESVAWQNNTVHDGFDPASPLVPPLATPRATPTCSPGVVTLQGSITDDDPTKNTVFGAMSSCTVSPPCPGEVLGHYAYDAYQLTNPSGNPTCITVTLSDPQCIYSEVYLGSFDPNNACTNYLADSDFAASYSVTVPGSATIWVVVEDFTEGIGCANYTVTVSGLDVCPSPTPTASPSATATATATATPPATPTPRPTPTPRSAPTPRRRPTPAPRS